MTDKRVVGALNIDMPEDIAHLMVVYFSDPDSPELGFQELIGVINAFFHVALEVDVDQAEVFLPIILPALRHAINRLETIDTEAFDPNWRQNLVGFIKGEKKH